MTEKAGAFDEVIATLSTEASDLERRAAKLRAIIRDLREVSGRSPVMLTHSGRDTNSVATITQAVLMIEGKPLNERRGAIPEGRVPTSHVILTELAGHPGGITFADLASAVFSRIQSKAGNRRKLIHGTLDYLESKGRIRRDGATGRIHLIEQRKEGA